MYGDSRFLLVLTKGGGLELCKRGPQPPSGGAAPGWWEDPSRPKTGGLQRVRAQDWKKNSTGRGDHQLAATDNETIVS